MILQRGTFPGWHPAEYTQVPNELFDDLLPTLSGAEIKTLLYIIRRTNGFGRTSDAITIQQMLEGIVRKDGRRLDNGTGLAESTLRPALKSLSDQGIIVITRNTAPDGGSLPSTFALRWHPDAVLNDPEPDGTEGDYQQAPPTILGSRGVVKNGSNPPSQNRYPQKKDVTKESTRQTGSTPANAGGAEIKPSRQTRVIDAIRALGLSYTLTARDGAAIKKESGISPERIAAAYAELLKRSKTSRYYAENLAVAFAIERINGLEQPEAVTPFKPRSNAPLTSDDAMERHQAAARAKRERTMREWGAPGYAAAE